MSKPGTRPSQPRSRNASTPSTGRRTPARDPRDAGQPRPVTAETAEAKRIREHTAAMIKGFLDAGLAPKDFPAITLPKADEIPDVPTTALGKAWDKFVTTPAEKFEKKLKKHMRVVGLAAAFGTAALGFMRPANAGEDRKLDDAALKATGKIVSTSMKDSKLGTVAILFEEAWNYTGGKFFDQMAAKAAKDAPATQTPAARPAAPAPAAKP